MFSVVDLVTGEIYGGKVCTKGRDCDAKNGEIMEAEDDTFRHALEGAIKPLGR